MTIVNKAGGRMKQKKEKPSKMFRSLWWATYRMASKCLIIDTETMGLTQGEARIATKRMDKELPGHATTYPPAELVRVTVIPVSVMVGKKTTSIRDFDPDDLSWVDRREDLARFAKHLRGAGYGAADIIDMLDRPMSWLTEYRAMDSK